MNISQRLRTCAKHTGLDAVIELLNDAADEIDRLKGAQPADVTLDEVMQAAKKATAPEWQDVIDGWHMGLDLMAFARAILARHPERVPMTDEQIRSMCKQGWVFETARQWVHVIEAHHGITAQDKKEGA